MYPLNCRMMPYRFVSRLLSAAIQSRFLAIALVFAILAWVGKAALAQTVTFNGPQTMLPAGVMEPSGFSGDTSNIWVIAGPAGGGVQTMMDGWTDPSYMSSHAGFGDSTSSGALSAARSFVASGMIMDGGPIGNAMQVNAPSALLGRSAVSMVRGADALPRHKVATIGKGLETARYWTLRRKIETAAVTLLHMADAAQTCWNEANTPRWQEQSPMTPKSCQGASVVLVGSGPIFQWASYRLTQRYPHSRFWALVDHGIPQIEISVSTMAIRCSNNGSGCNRYGF